MTNKIKKFAELNRMSVEETELMYYITSWSSVIIDKLIIKFVKFAEKNNLKWMITTRLNENGNEQPAIAITKGRD